MRGDLIAVVERAYSLDGTDDAWLDGVVAAAAPLIDRGLGVFGWTWSFGGAPKIPYVSTSRPEVARMVVGINARAPPAALRDTYVVQTGLKTASEATGLGEKTLEDQGWREFAHPLGVYDALCVNVVADPAGFGCTLGAALPGLERARPAARRTWDRLAAHVGAGLRLRHAVSRTLGLDGAEAVLTPSGRVEHATAAAATPGARERLRAAAVAVDRARGRLRRRDPDEALDVWRGLVAGRWSLVEHFERGGRRYLVARRNDPAVVDPRSLSLRERQVAWCCALGHSNKLIAYELGIGVSSVATYLARVLVKLGLRSRVELIALVQRAGGPAKDV